MDEQRSKNDQRSKKVVPGVSRCLPDGTLIELVYRPDRHQTFFAIYQAGRWTIQRHFDLDDGSRLIPFSPDNNLIKTEAVLLPSEPKLYGGELELLSAIEQFIHRYVDLSEAFESIASYYVVLTWLYDAFNEVPYLRLQGDFGSGKTRALLALGSLCYKPFFASGASTVSPIFHTLNAFGGTLVLDEADFRFSDEKSEIVKMLNNGNVRGMPVLRTMITRQREFNPQAFQVFGPKIVATRGRYEDKGLESRFLTEEMGVRKLRSDVPISLSDDFREEARELRNKLLLFRFHRRFDVRLDPALADPTLEPRVNQILLPLLSIVQDPSLREEIRSVAKLAQSTVVGDRALLAEAQVLEILAEMMEAADRPVVPLSELVVSYSERYGQEHEHPITPRWVGRILRKRLNVHTYKSHGVYVVPLSEIEKVRQLCTRYGVDLITDSTTLSGDMGT